ncbi:MAG: hypothetical protein ACI9K5_001144 [Gammaproteobacteria bacterium]|jgi:hypothetical protein
MQIVAHNRKEVRVTKRLRAPLFYLSGLPTVGLPTVGADADQSLPT